jgi:hypothetical protein
MYISDALMQQDAEIQYLVVFPQIHVFLRCLPSSNLVSVFGSGQRAFRGCPQPRQRGN